ncbi:MAG: hypothetical protein QT04_C0030G0001 [archaeon GW2011_AR11]|nr:MAG: hypothetical protein QT04_C0030G0001 [archaeon GW2011_AR11]
MILTHPSASKNPSIKRRDDCLPDWCRSSSKYSVSTRTFLNRVNNWKLLAFTNHIFLLLSMWGFTTLPVHLESIPAYFSVKALSPTKIDSGWLFSNGKRTHLPGGRPKHRRVLAGSQVILFWRGGHGCLWRLFFGNVAIGFIHFSVVGMPVPTMRRRFNKEERTPEEHASLARRPKGP